MHASFECDKMSYYGRNKQEMFRNIGCYSCYVKEGLKICHVKEGLSNGG
jgi:hypothetical protein